MKLELPLACLLGLTSGWSASSGVVVVDSRELPGGGEATLAASFCSTPMRRYMVKDRCNTVYLKLV